MSQTPGVAIRIRRADDLADCVAVLRRVYEQNGYPGRWPADPAGWISHEVVTAWVDIGGGQVVGHVGLGRGLEARCLREATGKEPAETATVVRLFVDPGARRGGVGRALLGAAVAEARARGLQPVLDVEDDSLGAIALYERSGWRLAGRGPAWWLTADGHRPVLRYYVLPQRLPARPSRRTRWPVALLPVPNR
jgi:GNAT superfamily N-acetyltransferase